MGLFNRNAAASSAAEVIDDRPRAKKAPVKKKAKAVNPAKPALKQQPTDGQSSAKEKRRAKAKQKNDKQVAKKNAMQKKRARKRHKGQMKESAYDDQMTKGMSDPRLDRLASTPDIWEKMAEDGLYDILRQMGNGDRQIRDFQRNRVMQAILIGIVVSAIGFAMQQNMVMVGGIGVGFLIYKMKFGSIKGMYRQWRFERELAFSRFVRLLIPYLKQSGGAVSLYTVFNKMLERMDNEADRNSLYMLMGEMSSRPGDIRPFYDFAERSSGSDMAYLIMSTVYDFQQSTQDTSVIDELGKMASDYMMTSIDEIIAFKIRRFGMFPTKIVLSSFILVVGFAAGVLLQNVMELMNSTGGAGLF